MVLIKQVRWAAALAALATGGCAWLDEGPSVVTLRPADYSPSRSPGYAMDSLYGVHSAMTGEISAFLGTRRFRIVFIHPYTDSYLYVLEPGADSSVPGVTIYPGGGGFAAGDTYLQHCRIAPDGSSLVYTTGAGVRTYLTSQWLQTLGADRWMLPLASRANGSQGLLGYHPFWYLSGGRQRVALAGLIEGPPGGFRFGEMRTIEQVSDSGMGPIEPLRLRDASVWGLATGISRDGGWISLRNPIRMDEEAAGDYLVPPGRLSDSAFMGNPDSLKPYFAGIGISLNPFDPEASSHQDYYLTPSYGGSRFLEARGLDSLAAPRHLDGAPADDRGQAESIWICDKDRRIVFSQALPDINGEGVRWVRWTNHPNFALANRGGNVYLVKLAETPEALLANPETGTLHAAGVLRLFSSRTQWSNSDLDVDMWIGGAP